MPSSPSNRRKTRRIGRFRDEPETPKVEMADGPLAGLTSQAPTKLSAAESPSPSTPTARPRSATLRPTTRRKATASGAIKTQKPRPGEGEQGDSKRILTSAAPKDNTRQMMFIGGAAGGGLLLLIIVLAVASSSPTPRRRDREPVTEPSRSYSAPRRSAPTRRAPVHVHRNTGSIMVICSNSDLHPDKEVVIRDCPACGATSRFLWNKDAENYSCNKCKGVVGHAQIECPDCRRKPRVTRLKHGP